MYNVGGPSPNRIPNGKGPIQQNNSFKSVEYIQLEGHFKLKKVFSFRSQIPIDPLEDELHVLIPSERSSKTKTE